MPADDADARALLLRRRRFTLDSLARFHPIPKRLLNAPKGTWKRELLVENPVARERDPQLRRTFEERSTPAFPTETPHLDAAIEAFLTARGTAEGDWAEAFVQEHRGLLEAKYVDDWRMLGRDWEPTRSPGWKWLGASKRLRWTPGFLAVHADCLDWRSLSANEALPWSEALLEQFSERWDWEVLSRNEALPWSETLVRRYRDRLHPRALSGNPGVPFEVLVATLGDDLDFRALSLHSGVPWSEALLARHEQSWDWERLSWNRSLPWSEALLRRFARRWNWRTLGHVAARSDALLAAFEDRWDWDDLATWLDEDWTEARLHRWAHRLNWEAVSGARLAWSPGLLRAFDDRWRWPTLAANAAVYETCVKPFVDEAFLVEIVESR